MGVPSEDDRDAIDRAFAELVAGYHLTADRPDPLRLDPLTAESADEPGIASPAPDEGERAANWPADPPLFGFVETPSEAPPTAEDPTEERYIPAPLPPLE